jgi:hypothetical protein
MTIRLDIIDDDTLLYVFAFLSIPEILALRQVSTVSICTRSNPNDLSQTCWRIYRLSSFRIVWKNACITHVLRRHYPFPSSPINSMDSSELEKRTRHAYRLSTRWQSPSCTPRKMVIFDATSTTPVSDLRFVPGHDGKWLLTVSKGIWSVITVWDIGDGLRKMLEWSPKGAFFNGFALNTDSESDGTLAVSVVQEESVHFQI